MTNVPSRGFRASGFGILSAFGFRISSFGDDQSCMSNQTKVPSAASTQSCDRKRLAEMQSDKEFALDAARRKALWPGQPSVDLAASQLYETLLDFNLDHLKKRLRKKPEIYTTLLGALVRLSQAD